MANYKTSEFKNALEKKGFKLDQTHHEMYWYFLDGKKTTIKTRISHSEKNYDDYLLNERKKQLHLSKSDFILFVKCPLTAEQYRQKLIDIKRIQI
jgi:hypothetical protein